MNYSDKGFVVWLTGLPGSGKSTIAKLLYNYFKNLNKKVELLDGDLVRPWLSPEAGFTREDRTRHLRRVAFVSNLLARNGVIVIASFVSPYRDVRRMARELIKNFVEVYVKCPLNLCIERDPKGLYKKALAGEIKHMTGIDDPYEEPENPEIIVDTSTMNPNECFHTIVKKLKELNYLPPQV